MKLDYVEFDDPDDALSVSYPSKKDSGTFPIRITPEAMLIVLPNGGRLDASDKEVFGTLLRMVYEQGKRVGMELNA